MKYLKLFENKDMYLEIDVDEYYEWLGGNNICANDIDNYVVGETGGSLPTGVLNFISRNWEVYTNKELDVIYNLLPYDSKINKFGIKSELCVKKNKNLLTFINKLRDEWFLLISYPSLRPLEIKYYKCDQFDGLIKCIKEKVIKNK